MRFSSNFKKKLVRELNFPTWYFFWSFGHGDPSIRADFGEVKRFFAIFIAMDEAFPDVRLFFWVAESKEELGRLLFRYSEYQSGPGNYLNEQHEVREVDENTRNYRTSRSYDLQVFVPPFRARPAQVLGWEVNYLSVPAGLAAANCIWIGTSWYIVTVSCDYQTIRV